MPTAHSRTHNAIGIVHLVSTNVLDKQAGRELNDIRHTQLPHVMFRFGSGMAASGLLSTCSEYVHTCLYIAFIPVPRGARSLLGMMKELQLRTVICKKSTVRV